MNIQVCSKRNKLHLSLNSKHKWIQTCTSSNRCWKIHQRGILRTNNRTWVLRVKDLITKIKFVTIKVQVFKVSTAIDREYTVINNLQMLIIKRLIEDAYLNFSMFKLVMISNKLFTGSSYHSKECCDGASY